MNEFTTSTKTPYLNKPSKMPQIFAIFPTAQIETIKSCHTKIEPNLKWLDSVDWISSFSPKTNFKCQENWLKINTAAKLCCFSSLLSTLPSFFDWRFFFYCFQFGEAIKNLLSLIVYDVNLDFVFGFFSLFFIEMSRFG